MNLRVPYGELKHSGKATRWAPFALALYISLTAAATFLFLSAPTANWIRATFKPAIQ